MEPKVKPPSVYALLDNIDSDELLWFPEEKYSTVRSAAHRLSCRDRFPRKTFATRKTAQGIAVFRTDGPINNPDIRKLLLAGQSKNRGTLRQSLRDIPVGESQEYDFSKAETLRQTLYFLAQTQGSEYQVKITVTRKK